MHATEKLSGEHRLIEQVLDALTDLSTKLERSGARARLGKFVEFFMGYVDLIHHVKEEQVLFAAMVDHGFSRQTGPVAVLIQDHETARRRVKALRQASRLPNWDDKVIKEVKRTIGDYVHMMRGHIEKEDLVLYQVANTKLPEAVRAEIDRRYELLVEEHLEASDRGEALGAELVVSQPSRGGSPPAAG